MLERKMRLGALGGLLLLGLVGCGEEESGPATPSTPSDTPDAGGSGPSIQIPPLTSPDAGEDEGPVDPNAPTWHQHIAPLVSEKCSGCHVEGGIGPFSVKSYESAKRWASAMAGAVEAGSMPPFLAQETDKCKPKHKWQNDIRLTPEQKKLLRDWAEAKAPEGDADNAAKLVPPPATALAREDVIVKIPKEFTVDGKKDIHTCVLIDPNIAEDGIYGIGTQLTSGNDKVLHHVVSYLITPSDKPDPLGVDTLFSLFGVPKPKQTKEELIAQIKAEKNIEPGGSYDCFGGPGLEKVPFQMLNAWAPGSTPLLAPPDSGQPLPKGSLVLLDIHYHPTGTPEKDSTTKLSLMTTKTKPKYIARTVLIGNFEGPRTIAGTGEGDLLLQPGEMKKEFMVPPGAANHIEDMTWKWGLPIPLKVTGLGAHMHYVGRKMRISLEHTTPTMTEDKEECLLETPSWDFNWQRGYMFDAAYEKLPEMRPGDTLKFHCEFDNSMNNRFVVQALKDQGKTEPVEVRLGEDTLDEMCLGAIGIIYPNL